MKKVMVLAGISASAAVALSGSQIRSVAAQDATDKPAYFVENVQPILQQNCGRCHLDGNARGGLSLASRGDILRGGDNGPALVPGDPTNSLLLKMVRHEEGHRPMPPGGQALSPESIDVIAKWVKAGAIMPNLSSAVRSGADAAKQSMDLMSAKKILAAVETAADQNKQHVAICVMDTNGDVVAFERMNGTGRTPLATAEGKARAVLMFGIPTGQIADAQRDKKPITATITAPPIGIGGGAGLTLMAGGVPIYKDGKMIGSVGVGGSASEEDERFAQMGINAAGLAYSTSGTPIK